MHIKSISQQHFYVSLKPYTLVGFEPGSSVHLADAECRQGCKSSVCACVRLAVRSQIVQLDMKCW
jgi:hypothetical protein